MLDPQSWNSYAYARNNPLKYNDPDGEFWDTVVDLSFTGYDTWKGLYHGTQALGGYASQGVGKLIGREGMENRGRQQATVAVGQLKGDLGNLAIDAAGTILPFVPIAGIKATKNADRVVGAAQDIKHGASNPVVRDAIKYGQEQHKLYNPGTDYLLNKNIPGTKLRPDALSLKTRIVRELKPESPTGIKKGVVQLKNYVEAASKSFGVRFRGVLDTYKPKK